MREGWGQGREGQVSEALKHFYITPQSSHPKAKKLGFHSIDSVTSPLGEGGSSNLPSISGKSLLFLAVPPTPTAARKWVRSG